MGLLEVLTIVFVVLKLVDVIDWSWWLVLLPEIISVGMGLLVMSLAAAGLVVVGSGKRRR